MRFKRYKGLLLVLLVAALTLDCKPPVDRTPSPATSTATAVDSALRADRMGKADDAVSCASTVRGVLGRNDGNSCG
jgi:hypothetical protein